eukprot:g11299.t1
MLAQEEFCKTSAGVLFTSQSSERGMDYPDVTLVLQVMAPMSRQQYIHRVGRTARAGKEGEALLLLLDHEEPFMSEIQDLPITRSRAAAQLLNDEGSRLAAHVSSARWAKESSLTTLAGAAFASLLQHLQSQPFVELEGQEVVGGSAWRDVVLCRYRLCYAPFTIFVRGMLCWPVNHIGLAIRASDFEEGSQLRHAHPEMQHGKLGQFSRKTYMFHALVSGMKVWDLERYLHDLRKDSGDIFVRQLQWTERGQEQRKAFHEVVDSAFEEFKDRPFENDQVTFMGSYCDQLEPTCCANPTDLSSLFCSELVAEVFQRGQLLAKSRAAAEFTPVDYLKSDGQSVEQAQLETSLVTLGPLRCLQ